MNAETQVVGTALPGEGDPRPVVALPRAGLPGFAIAAISLLAALALFLFLNGRRENAQSDSATRRTAPATAFSAPPPLAIPVDRPAPEAYPPPATVREAEPLRLRLSPPVRPFTAPARLPPPPAAADQVEPTWGAPDPFDAPPSPPPAEPARAPALNEPALVLDRGTGVAATPAEPAAAAGQPGAAPGREAARTPGAERPAARLGRIGDPAAVMPVGTLIQAVLETPIDTFKPGLARAIVSRDARSFDSRQVLVPRGSRLTGEYQADARSGQDRVLINWTQLIRPDGSVIRLDSPAADALGGAGVAGKADGTSLGRFASGVLRTALAVGTSWASWSGRAPVVVGLPTAQLPAVVGQGTNRGRSQRIRVKPGTAFNVFVARTLDFSDTAPAR